MTKSAFLGLSNLSYLSILFFLKEGSLAFAISLGNQVFLEFHAICFGIGEEVKKTKDSALFRLLVCWQASTLCRIKLTNTVRRNSLYVEWASNRITNTQPVNRPITSDAHRH